MLDDSQEHWWKVKDEHGYVKVLYSLKWKIYYLLENSLNWNLEKKVFFKLFRVKSLINFILNSNSKLIRWHLLCKFFRQYNQD